MVFHCNRVAIKSLNTSSSLTDLEPIPVLGADSPSGGRRPHFTSVHWINKARCPPPDSSLHSAPLPPHLTCVKVPSAGLSCCEDVCGVRADGFGGLGGATFNYPNFSLITDSRGLFLIKDTGGLSSSACVHNKLNEVSFEQSKHLLSSSSLFTSYPWEGAAPSSAAFHS